MDDIRGLSVWRQMPPACFPVLLGAIALALAWFRNGQVLGVGPWFGTILLILVILVYTLWAVGYAAKFMRKPSVFAQDLATIPGRQGLATMMLSGMLIAAALTPVSSVLAGIVLFVALAGQCVVAIMAGAAILELPKDQRTVTPVWHLIFVGFIVGSQAAALMQMSALASGILALTLIVALAIYGASIEARRRTQLDSPMRPLFMIHLAPVSLFGTTAALLNLVGTSIGFGIVATLVALVLLVRLPWLMAAGFSPFWAAFTFPVAAYMGLMLMLSEVSAVFHWIGVILLIAMTFYTPVILYRILKLTWSGQLSKATNAAHI